MTSQPSSPEPPAAAPDFDARFRKDFEALVRWRRDVREFRTGSVPQQVLDFCLEMANLAPSVGLSQPWRFIPVDTADARAAVIDSFEQCNRDALIQYQDERANLYARLKLEGLRTAPRHFAVFSDTETDQGHGLGRNTMPEMLDYSALMAVHTFWLAARSHGLGVGWVSILNPEAVRSACDAPASWRLMAYLCVGWPCDDSETPQLEKAGWERRRFNERAQGDF